MPYDPQAHAAAARAGGYWLDTSFDAYLSEAVAATPDKPAVVGYRADRAEPRRLSYRELGDAVARCAAALRRLGIARGDVVAVQLPNWWEFAVITLAAWRVGALLNPLMPIFRERELQFMLGFAEAKLVVVPKTFRGHDHEAMARSLQESLPGLRHVAVVDGSGDHAFDQLLLGRPERLEAGDGVRPDDPAVLMYTSGTTGSPKGAVHTSNTLVACTTALAERFELDASDVLFACSPLGHMTGFAAAFLLALRAGASAVFQDIWDAKRGTELMAAEGASYMAAATPFLSDICDAAAAGAPRPASLRSFLCAGATIPPVLIERAARELDLKVCSLWGMTEALAATLTPPGRAADKSATSDGTPLAGVEVKVVDEAGEAVAPGLSGRLLVRGAQMFTGYYKRPDLPTFDAHGWFDTGDLARMDDEGYIRITGRTKDVLIRGGENVPVVEIEALLHKHPAVVSAAIVGYPDERLGERACAFLALRPGQSLDLPGVQAWMAESKVAKQYWPERVEIVPDLPRTATGKVQKFVLREAAARR
jgi:cyclohexanecarboxylate-CoA ligase